MKNFKRIISLITAAIMLAVIISSCGNSKNLQTVKISSLNKTEAVYTENANHTINSEDLIFVSKSGLIELYFDTVTYAVSIKETSNNKMWLSMPYSDSDYQQNTADVLSITLSNGENVYEMNSQDNSVAFSTASFKPVTDGIEVTYNMALTAEAAKNGAADGVPFASVAVNYTVVDGSFNAKIDCSQNSVSNGFVIEDLRLLNYFGSTVQSQSGDFILVPDGSGATVMLGDNVNDDYSTKSFNVYGSDLSVRDDIGLNADDDINADAILGVYGIKQGDNAFMTLIQKGDAIAKISSHKYTEEGTYSRVGASFNITDVSYTGKEGKIKKYIGESYDGEINLCFRFLSNKNSSYSGMAAACRELLIRYSALSTKTVSTAEHLPFSLNLWGTAITKNNISYKKLTTFEQAYDILNMLKAKSVNNAVIRYCGVLDGANSQYLLSKSEVSKALGSKRDFEELKDYVETQQFEMYLDINIMTFGKKGGLLNTATDMTGENLTIYNSDSLSSAFGKDSTKLKALKINEIEKNTSDYINNTKDFLFGGYSINDAGKYLYSDYSSSKLKNRADSISVLSENISKFANGNKLMIDGGNFYMLKNADVVSNLEYTLSYPETEAYIAVPFIEMILHGIADYTLTPVNLADDSQKAFLKSIEYGALPSYEWYYEKTDIEELDNKYYYENQINKAAENYLIADNTIGSLRNARMTSHYKVQDGVYCTEYNNSIIIYFNYNEKAVTINSITVPPTSCFRVN